MRHRLALLAGLSLLIGAVPMAAPLDAVPTTVHAAPFAMPPGFVDEQVVGGLFGATAIGWAADGRMFIAEKEGRVKVFQNGVLLPTPFVDLSTEVSSWWDRGLLGMAVDPQFPTRPYIYLLYTYDPPELPGAAGASNGFDGDGARVARLLRVAADPAQGFNRALPAGTPGARLVLMGSNSTYGNIGNPSSNVDYTNVSCTSGSSYVRDCIPADGPSHGIGTVAFGKDGSLFVGNGDTSHWVGGDPRPLRVQNLDGMTGKLWHINPDTGNGYADNPFATSDLTANRSKVWSYGFRNPFRFAIHPVTGEPFVGDVGAGTWEEINTGKGKNFGWPCYYGGFSAGQYRSLRRAATAGITDSTVCTTMYAQEATAPPSGPWMSYHHSDATKSPRGIDAAGGSVTTVGTSVTAGDFYIGDTYPITYQGGLFISDFNNEWMKVLTATGSLSPTIHHFATDTFAQYDGVVQLRSGLDTNIYYVYFDAGVSNDNQGLPANSQVRRIRYVGSGNRPPVAELAATPTSGSYPLRVAFSSVGSYDPDAQSLSYSWNLGNGVITSTASPVYTYTVPGIYTATLTVTDGAGGSDSAWVVLTVGNTAPVPTISTPTISQTFAVGQVIGFSGSATDAEEGAIPASRLQWEVLLHHAAHVHGGLLRSSGSGGSVVAPDHGDGTRLTICLTASDAQGLSRQTCRDVWPRTVVYTFQSDPPGLDVVYEGSERTTPFTATTIVGAQQPIAAELIQAQRSWQSWSNGGAWAHTLPISSTAQTVTVRYTNLPPQSLPAALADGTLWPVTMAFSGTLSFDPEGAALGYRWDFGDGTGDSEVQPTHTYARPGAYIATLTVTDELGATASNTVALKIDNNLPSATILEPLAGQYQPGATISMRGVGQDREDGTLSGEGLVWQIISHSGATSETLLSGVGAEASFVVPQTLGSATIEVRLTALDSNGGTASTSVLLTPQNTQPPVPPEEPPVSPLPPQEPLGRRGVWLPLLAR